MVQLSKSLHPNVHTSRDVQGACDISTQKLDVVSQTSPSMWDIALHVTRRPSRSKGEREISDRIVRQT
jgi:hypothetical protein